MTIILGLESSCDDTSAAVLKDGKILTNVISSQQVHAAYGGVVPEYASREHQKNLISIVLGALSRADVDKSELSAIAYAQGPGLIGSLLVTSAFAKGLSLSLGIPLISVDHLHAHVIANFIEEPKPDFPLLCLLVSGGHTQIIIMEDHLTYKTIGKTIDDAAGEAFDKAAKVIDLPYPGGPAFDAHARKGNPGAFYFPTPRTPELNFSFSGLKTHFLYTVRDQLKVNPDFLTDRIDDLCASYQHRIVTYLLQKLEMAAIKYQINEIAIAGGVAANSSLREKLHEIALKKHWKTYIPALEYCTDNAAMIAMTAYYKYLAGEFDEGDKPNYASGTIA